MTTPILPAGSLLIMTLLLSPISSATAQDDTVDNAIVKRFHDELIKLTPGDAGFTASVAYGQLGNEQVQKVRAPEPFWIAKYEVPQNLWQVVMGENPSRWTGDRNSVEMLTFDESIDFCRRLTQRLRKLDLIDDNQLIRLPTELEWEYAVRAGTDTDYSFGDNPEALGDYGWFTGNASGNDPPVGAKKPNAWKIYDGHGYLWEFCLPTNNAQTLASWNRSDWHRHFEAGQAVVRGGSWKDPAASLRSGFRKTLPRDTKDDAVGLRCVLVSNLEPHPLPGFAPQAQTSIVDSDAAVEWLWNEGEFTEGPAVAPDRSIYFSDIGNRLLRFDPQTNEVEVVREPSGRSNGLMFRSDGKMVICEGANTGGGRRISIGLPSAEPQTLSSGYEGQRFNSPNDLVIDAQNRVYFTDPRYVGDEPRELDIEAVFVIDPDGTTNIATSDVSKPNGIVLSPDGSLAYVADHHPDSPKQLLRFRVDKAGKLVDKKVLFDFGVSRGIDGMTIDRKGNVYATAGDGMESGIYVFDPEGQALAFLPTPGAPTNCVFGGGDEANMLYVTAQGPEPKSPDETRSYGLGRIPLKLSGHHVVKFRQ